MARKASKTAMRTLVREAGISFTAMFFAVAVPPVLLFFVWSYPVHKFPSLFSIANESEKYYELLAALVPLLVLEAIVAMMFSWDFEKAKSLLAPIYGLMFKFPQVIVFAAAWVLSLITVARKNIVFEPLEFWIVTGIFVTSVIMLFLLDAFIAMARAESKIPRRASSLPRTP